MYQVMKTHYKDLALLALLAILGWYIWTTVNELRVWKSNVTQLVNISAQYMQKDNPSVLRQIITPAEVSNGKVVEKERQALPRAATRGPGEAADTTGGD